MGPRPEGCSLERKDNSQGYCKENCRWATPIEQAANTRQALKIEHNGETHTLMEWSRITGISKSTLWNRLMKFGYTVEEALTVPPSPNNERRKKLK